MASRSSSVMSVLSVRCTEAPAACADCTASTSSFCEKFLLRARMPQRLPARYTSSAPKCRAIASCSGPPAGERSFMGRRRRDALFASLRESTVLDVLIDMVVPSPFWQFDEHAARPNEGITKNNAGEKSTTQKRRPVYKLCFWLGPCVAIRLYPQVDYAFERLGAGSGVVLGPLAAKHRLAWNSRCDPARIRRWTRTEG